MEVGLVWVRVRDVCNKFEVVEFDAELDESGLGVARCATIVAIGNFSLVKKIGEEIAETFAEVMDRDFCVKGGEIVNGVFDFAEFFVG